MLPCYQFIMEFLLRVMKNTWLLPPDLTDAKNTCLEAKKCLLMFFIVIRKGLLIVSVSEESRSCPPHPMVSSA